MFPRDMTPTPPSETTKKSMTDLVITTRLSRLTTNSDKNKGKNVLQNNLRFTNNGIDDFGVLRLKRETPTAYTLPRGTITNVEIIKICRNRQTCRSKVKIRQKHTEN